ncbi:MAG: cobalamin-binding protein [Pseudomonadales bacterium]|nr:cobalamin-binding protein [Pseudomonadales bacterium]
MIKLIAGLFLYLLLPVQGFGAATPIESKSSSTAPFVAVDDSGRRLVFPQRSQRIVSLAPHITELLFAAGAGDRIVATSRFSDYPAAAKDIPTIGDAHSVNMEALLALNVDLVVAWQSGVSHRTIEMLERLGIRYFLSEPKTVENMIESLQVFGRIAGDPLQANQRAEQLLQRWQSLQKMYLSKSPVRVFYQIWYEPLFTISSPHIIGSVIETCGGENIFSGQPQAVFRTQLEAVILAKPEVILFGGLNRPRDRKTNNQFWQRFPQLPAVKNDHLIALPEEWLNRPSPRLIKGAEYMCQQLQRVRVSRGW